MSIYTLMKSSSIITIRWGSDGSLGALGLESEAAAAEAVLKSLWPIIKSSGRLGGDEERSTWGIVVNVDRSAAADSLSEPLWCPVDDIGVMDLKDELAEMYPLILSEVDVLLFEWTAREADDGATMVEEEDADAAAAGPPIATWCAVSALSPLSVRCFRLNVSSLAAAAADDEDAGGETWRSRFFTSCVCCVNRSQ